MKLSNNSYSQRGEPALGDYVVEDTSSCNCNQHTSSTQEIDSLTCPCMSMNHPVLIALRDLPLGRQKRFKNALDLLELQSCETCDSSSLIAHVKSLLIFNDEKSSFRRSMIKRARRKRISISTPPSPPLVGIEPNPGPKGKGMKKNVKKGNKTEGRLTKLEKTIQRESSGVNASVSAIQSIRSYGKRNGKIYHPRSLSVKGDMTRQYISTLADPFSYGNLRLGFGTFVPTNLATLYVRGSFTSNLDGSFQVMLIPANGAGGTNARAGLYVSSATSLATPAFSHIPWQNQAVVFGLGIENRVVAGGIRVLPLMAATSVPGVIYNAQVPSDSFNNLNAVAANTSASYPYCQWGDGRKGATGLVRPCDLEAFQFRTQTAGGYPDALTTTFSSVPRITGLGFPASTSIFVEAVLHVECLPSQQNTQTNYVGGGQSDAEIPKTLTDEHSSVDSLWNTVKHYLPSAEQMTVASDLLDAWQNGIAFRHNLGTHMNDGDFVMLRDEL